VIWLLATNFIANLITYTLIRETKCILFSRVALLVFFFSSSFLHNALLHFQESNIQQCIFKNYYIIAFITAQPTGDNLIKHFPLQESFSASMPPLAFSMADPPH